MRDEAGAEPDWGQDALQARDLLYPRLFTLIQLIDESAAITYPRTLHRRHTTRLLVFLIGLSGSVTSGDLVFASGYEKAQISRGLKGLAESDLIDRPELRGLIRLSEAGLQLFEQIMVIARARDAQLRDGLTQGEIQRFLEMTGTLIERASRLPLVEEPDDSSQAPERCLTSISAPSVHDLVMPALRCLMVYIRRSGSAMFRQEVELPTLEWRVLLLIADHVSISLSALIPLAARDKSQVARAVKQLHSLGLVRRHDEGRVNLTLELTAEGAVRNEKIRAIGRQHDQRVFAGFPQEQHRFYLDVLDRIIGNAATLLATEQANAGEQGAARLESPGGVQAELEQLRAENHRLRQQLDAALNKLATLSAP